MEHEILEIASRREDSLIEQAFDESIPREKREQAIRQIMALTDVALKDFTLEDLLKRSRSYDSLVLGFPVD